MLTPVTGAEKSAIEFIEENIELIEDSKWEDFFWNMLSNPNDWIVSHATSYYIIEYFKQANVQWDENTRQKVLTEALQNVCRSFQDSNTDITGYLEIKLYDLYYVNQGFIMPREDQCNWLGYSKGQFIEFIQQNKKKVGCQILDSSPLSKPFNTLRVEIF